MNIYLFFIRGPLLKTVILPVLFLPALFLYKVDNNFNLYLSVKNLKKKFLNLKVEVLGLYFFKKILLYVKYYT